MSSTIWKSRPTSSANARHGLLLALRHLGHPERARDRGREQAAGLQPVQRGEVVAAAGDVEVLAADHAERRLRRARGRPPASGRKAPAAAPRPAARRRRGCRPPRRSAAQVLARPRRSSSSSSAGRSSWTSEKVCTSSSAAAAGSAASGSAPAASAVARQSTGRTRLPPPASAWRSDVCQPAELRRQREVVEIRLDQLAQLVGQRSRSAARFACCSCASTSLAISASSERISIASSGSLRLPPASRACARAGRAAPRRS